MKKYKIGLLAIPLSIFATSVQSATITTTLPVSATVISTCTTVTATALAFGNYDPLAGSNLDGTSTIDVTCSSGTSFSISLNAGGSGDINSRVMSDGGSGELSYGLYTDASRSTVWGDGSTGSQVTGTGTGSAVQETVYGRIPSGQNDKPAGSYNDTITVSVDY